VGHLATRCGSAPPQKSSHPTAAFVNVFGKISS
jgi:hypothetical protein